MQSPSRRHERPDYVTWLCTLLILQTVVAVPLGATALVNAVSEPDFEGQPIAYWLILLPFLTAISAVFMLRGEEWARKFYLFGYNSFMALGLVFWFQPQVKRIFGMVLAGVFYYLWTFAVRTRGARRFFTPDRPFRTHSRSRSQPEPALPEEEERTMRRSSERFDY